MKLKYLQENKVPWTKSKYFHIQAQSGLQNKADYYTLKNGTRILYFEVESIQNQVLVNSSPNKQVPRAEFGVQMQNSKNVNLLCYQTQFNYRECRKKRLQCAVCKGLHVESNWIMKLKPKHWYVSKNRLPYTQCTWWAFTLSTCTTSRNKYNLSAEENGNETWIQSRHRFRV